jgi:hypothetical protein
MNVQELMYHQYYIILPNDSAIKEHAQALLLGIQN